MDIQVAIQRRHDRHDASLIITLNEGGLRST
jgi:hypothetical protein